MNRNVEFSDRLAGRAIARARAVDALAFAVKLFSRMLTSPMLLHVHDDVASTEWPDRSAVLNTQHTKNGIIFAITGMNLALWVLGAHIMLACAHASEVLFMVGDPVTTVLPNSQFLSDTVSGTSACPSNSVISDQLTDYISSPGTRVVPISVSACGRYLLSDLVSGLDWIKYNINYTDVNFISFGIHINDTVSNEIIRGRVEQFVRNRAIVSVAEGMWSTAPDGVYTVPIQKSNTTAEYPPSLQATCTSSHTDRYDRILRIAIASELGFFTVMFALALAWCIVRRSKCSRGGGIWGIMPRRNPSIDEPLPVSVPPTRPPTPVMTSTASPARSLCAYDCRRSKSPSPPPIVGGNRNHMSRRSLSFESFTVPEASPQHPSGEIRSQSLQRDPYIQAMDTSGASNHLQAPSGTSAARNHLQAPRHSDPTPTPTRSFQCTQPFSPRTDTDPRRIYARDSHDSSVDSVTMENSLDRSRLFISGRAPEYKMSPFNRGPVHHAGSE